MVQPSHSQKQDTALTRRASPHRFTRLVIFFAVISLLVIGLHFSAENWRWSGAKYSSTLSPSYYDPGIVDDRKSTRKRRNHTETILDENGDAGEKGGEEALESYAGVKESDAGVKNREKPKANTEDTTAKHGQKSKLDTVDSDNGGVNNSRIHPGPKNGGVSHTSSVEAMDKIDSNEEPKNDSSINVPSSENGDSTDARHDEKGQVEEKGSAPEPQTSKPASKAPERGQIAPVETNSSAPEPPADPLRLKIYKSCQKQEIGSRTCPTIMVIGCQKCGTTNFAYWLALIPGVVFGYLGGPEIAKEMHYFDSPSNFGIEGEHGKPKATDEIIRNLYNNYLDKFPIRNQSKMFAMDATPEHIYQHTTPASMNVTGIVNLEKTRFFFLVRDPVDRFHSAVAMMKRRLGNSGRHKKFVKINWNLNTIADRCIPVIKECRREARKNGVNPHVFCHKSYAIVRDDLCSTLYRGMYTDQLRNWLQYFPPNMFCIVALKTLSSNPSKALNEQAGRCLKDVGVDYSTLKTDLPFEVKKKYDSLDVMYPGLRKRLNDELFLEANAEFRSFIREKWGIDYLDL